MIGVDANVVVRLVMRDNEAQYQLTRQFFETEISEDSPAYLSIVVLVELAWVLQRTFKLSQRDILETFETLSDSFNVVLENEKLVAEAMRIVRKFNSGLADALIAANCNAAGCARTVTFDAAFARSGLASQL